MSNNCAGRITDGLARSSDLSFSGLENSNSHRTQRCIFCHIPRRAMVRAFCIAAAACCLSRWALLPIEVDGNSMEPTYDSGQASLANRLAYRFKSPKRGHVVSVKLPVDDQRLLKRVVGLPGDTVEMIDGVVSINGRPLVEPYAATQGGWSMPAIALEENEYWVIGDNRKASEFCTIRLEDIQGQVVL